MFCPKCGKQSDGSSFCGACGARVNLNPIVKPVLSNVGYDDTLPKNSNFAFVIIILLFIAGSIFIFLSEYRESYNYTKTISFGDYKFYLPIGYTTKIDKDETKGDSLYIYNDKISYQFVSTTDDFNIYTRNNYSNLKDALSKHGYTITNIEIKKINNKDILLAKFKEKDKEYYFYIYKYSNNDELLYGYVYSDSSVTEENLNELYEIIERIQ